MISVHDLIRKRGDLCEWCMTNKATERHHCLFHRMKGHPELDDERNLMLVCYKCHHSGKVNGFEVRQYFWKIQCARYGKAQMQAFWDGVLLRIKERFD